MVVLLILGYFAGPFIQWQATEEQLSKNVLLHAIPFILIFVAIILGFISLIWLLASVLNNIVSVEFHRPVEAILIGGIALGIVGMFQPWSFAAYRIGFHVLLVSTVGFIVWSHIVPKKLRRRKDVSDVSVSDIASRGTDQLP
jgi:hypothetical protein